VTANGYLVRFLAVFVLVLGTIAMQKSWVRIPSAASRKAPLWRGFLCLGTNPYDHAA